MDNLTKKEWELYLYKQQQGLNDYEAAGKMGISIADFRKMRDNLKGKHPDLLKNIQ